MEPAAALRHHRLRRRTSWDARPGDDAALHVDDLSDPYRSPTVRSTTWSRRSCCTDDWTFDGQSFPMTFWRRPLHATTDAFTTAGFRVAVIGRDAAMHGEPVAGPEWSARSRPGGAARGTRIDGGDGQPWP